MSDLRTRIANALRNMTGPNASGDPISYEGMADAVIRELGWERIVAYCEQQAAVGWRDVGTADEAMGRNIVAETVLTILEGADDE